MKVWPCKAAVLAALVGAGCADEFAPYNEVVGHRVLGIRASPPEIRPQEAAVIDALVTSESATYAWTWCPLPLPDPSTGECPLSEAELAAMLQAAGSDASPPPYDLGVDSRATFEHTFEPDLLAALCQAFRDQPLPEGVPRPRCGGRYDVTVRLVASSGDERIVAVRDLGLIYDEDYEPNANPHIAGARLGVPYFDLTHEDPVSVGTGFQYRLELDVSEEEAESYEALDDGELVTRRESLVVTWFYEAGDMDKSRTSFLEGTTDVVNLTTNHWDAPAAAAPGGERIKLYFVLRDNRGGIDWLQADLGLVE